MKKALLVLAVLCVAGIFSAKAQSSSDSSFVRDLSFAYINTNTLPYTATGSIDIAYGGKYLKDLRFGQRAVGYTLNLTSGKCLDINLAADYDSYLYVLDANFDTVILNDDQSWDDGEYGSRIAHNFTAGQYYIIVTEYDRESSPLTYTLTVEEVSSSIADFSALTYTPLTPGTSVTDTLKTTDGPIVSHWYSYFYGAYYARAYSMQISSPCVLDVNINHSFRTYILMDNNYNELYTNVIPTPGTYRLVVRSTNYFATDTTVATPFTVTTTTSQFTNYNALTYTPLGTFTDTTVNDTFVASYPYIQFNSYTLFRAKGYSFQGTQNKVVRINDDYGDAYYVLMDNNHNILKIGQGTTCHLLPNTGTYYLAILDYNDYECSTEISMLNYPTYYVDAINGNDSRNGLTPSTAFASLDTALVRSMGIGKFYLTEDYTFSGESFYAVYAEIYPYQKDIKLHWPTSYLNYPIIYGFGKLTFGEHGSNYYFISDSNYFAKPFFRGYNEGSRLEINNFKVRHCQFGDDFVTEADDVLVRNCEFTNDSIGDDFIQTSYNNSNSIKLTDVNFSQNNLHYYLAYTSYGPKLTFTMENTNVVGNTFDYTGWFGYSTLNLVSGSWRNNRMSSIPSDINNPNITAQNAAGLWLQYDTVNIGSGFSMDFNNYLCIDTATVVNIANNYTATNVAQIYPYRYEPYDYEYYPNYYEGRRVLWGSASALANNYQKFGIAQADNSSLWYIHPDGTIHTFPVSIDQAEEGTISLYPNPASNVLNIALQGSEVNEVAVIDIYGKTVARTAVAEGNNTLDISALPAGMYFVQLKANNSVKATQKLIKR